MVADARADLAFLVNGSVLAAAAGGCAVAWLIGHSTTIAAVSAAAIAALVSRVLYLLAVPTAFRLGEEVQGGAIDLLRLDLYTRLGLKPPLTQEDDRNIGRATNELLAFGVTTPDVLRDIADSEPPPAP